MYDRLGHTEPLPALNGVLKWTCVRTCTCGVSGPLSLAYTDTIIMHARPKK
jgi:hypothetical protein